MNNSVLDRLLEEYHSFCISLIAKLSEEHYNDERIMQSALGYKHEIGVLVLDLQIKSSQRGLEVYTKEIESLKGKIIEERKGIG